jgi:hypothetical protein
VGRAAALLGLLAALIAWYEVAPHLGAWAMWPSVALIAFVLIPACFLLVLIALPLWDWRGLTIPIPVGRVRLAFPTGLLLIALAIGLSKLDFPVGSNFCKLGGMTLLGWWFLGFFEEISWVVIVAVLIPWVDAYSVWRGPTKTLTSRQHEHIFDSLSITFVVPGGNAARLGLPDILFFAVFLGASVRFRLRPYWTFVGLTLGVGLTIVCATWWNVSGLPALPGIALGFLLPNADLLRRRLRLRPALGQSRG